jgi:hypothetical protein
MKSRQNRKKDVLEGQWLLPLGAPRERAKRIEYRPCGDRSCRTCREGRGPYLYAVWREGKKVGANTSERHVHEVSSLDPR